MTPWRSRLDSISILPSMRNLDNMILWKILGKDELNLETPNNLLYGDDCDETPLHLPDHEDIYNYHYA